MKNTRLNDNEVKEVARMQQKIDSYEGFIRATFMMGKSGTRINYQMFTHTDFSEEMHFIWEVVKESKSKQIRNAIHAIAEATAETIAKTETTNRN